MRMERKMKNKKSKNKARALFFWILIFCATKSKIKKQGACLVFQKELCLRLVIWFLIFSKTKSNIKKQGANLIFNIKILKNENQKSNGTRVHRIHWHISPHSFFSSILRLFSSYLSSFYYVFYNLLNREHRALGSRYLSNTPQSDGNRKSGPPRGVLEQIR